MKFSTVLSIAIALSSTTDALSYSSNEDAAAKGIPNIQQPPYPESKFGYRTNNIAVQIWTRSNHPELDKRGILAPHTDAGLNHLFIGAKTHSPILSYSPLTKTLSYNISSDRSQTFVLRGHFLALMVGNDAPGQIPVTRDTSNNTREGLMYFNGFSDEFWACKDVDYVNNLSSEFYQLMYYNALELPKNTSCYSVELIMKDEETLNRIRYPSKMLSADQLSKRIKALNLNGVNEVNLNFTTTDVAATRITTKSRSLPRSTLVTAFPRSNIRINSSATMGNSSTFLGGSYRFRRNSSVFGIIIFIAFTVFI